MGDAPGRDGSQVRRLVLLRHSKSSRDQGLPDAERPLSSRGRRDAAAAGSWLASHVGRPDLVLCSPSVRTRQTWARACEAEPDVLGPAPVRLEPTIYEAWSDTLLDLARAVPDDVATVVLVGHGPGLPDLAARLNQVSGDGPLGKFRTSAVASFLVYATWAGLGPGTAALTAYEVPRG